MLTRCRTHRTLASLLSLYLSLLRAYQASLQLQPKSSFSDDIFTFAFAATSVDLWAVPTPEAGASPFLTGVLTELRMRRLEELHVRRMKRTQLLRETLVTEEDSSTGKRKKKGKDAEEDTVDGKRSSSTKKRSKDERRSGAAKASNGTDRTAEDSDERMQQYADQLIGTPPQACTCNVAWRGQWDGDMGVQEEACGVWRLRTSFFHLLAYVSSPICVH